MEDISLGRCKMCETGRSCRCDFAKCDEIDGARERWSGGVGKAFGGCILEESLDMVVDAGSAFGEKGGVCTRSRDSCERPVPGLVVIAASSAIFTPAPKAESSGVALRALLGTVVMFIVVGVGMELLALCTRLISAGLAASNVSGNG